MVSVFCSWVFRVEGKESSGSYRYAVRCFGQKPMETQWWSAPQIEVKGAAVCPRTLYSQPKPLSTEGRVCLSL
jgi:hypothetical protein